MKTWAYISHAGGRRARFALVFSMIMLSFLLWGCGAAQSPAGGGAIGIGAGAGETSGADYSQPASVRQIQLGPSTGGEPSIYSDQVSQGYVVAQAKSPQRLKFQVSCGDQTYNYDLPSDGTRTAYPLNMGDGSYTFRIMQNTSGSNYVEICSQKSQVALESEFSPFLVSNQFCNYDDTSACVQKAYDVTAQASNQADVVKLVCEYVASHVDYDTDKAEKLSEQTGYIPDPDATLQEGKGVCFDYASLSAAMLRSMGIPTKIVTGYVGTDAIYHAWIMVYIDGTWHTALFEVDPNSWSRCDVTFAAAGSNEYVGDASSYTDRYVY